MAASRMAASSSISLADRMATCMAETNAANSVPADRLLVEVDEHLLGLQVLLDAPVTQLPAEARRLVAAPRGFDEGGLHVIDPHDAGLQRLHYPERLEDVPGPDGGGQAVRRRVGDPDRVR